jgi:hypothetical protein
MHIANKPAFDPRRTMVVKPAPVEKPVAEKPAAEVPRYIEQQQAAKGMLSRLATDAKLAAIMLNPVFAPHANAIAWAATGRAIARYETEVPRKELGDLMNEEQGKARKEILGLPKRYAEATGQAIQVTGQAIEDGAVATGNAIATGARATGNAVVTGAKAVGEGLFMGAAAIAGGLLMGGKFLLKGIGNGLSGLGGLLQKAGSTVENAGQ